MNINKQVLLKLLTAISKNEHTPYNITQFINTHAKRNRTGIEKYLSKIEAHLSTLEESIPLTDVFPIWTDENNSYWDFLMAITAYLVKSTLISKALNKHEIIEGDFKADKPLIIEGNLTINGNLSTCYLKSPNDINLIVLGDLTINGNYTYEDGNLIVFGDLKINGAYDEQSNYSLSIIGGEVSVQNYLNSLGAFYALGKVTSPMIYFNYNHGECGLNDGFKSLLFVESDHSGSFSIGDNEANLILINEIIGVEEKCKAEDFKNLLSLFKENINLQLMEIDFDKHDENEDEPIVWWLEEEHDLNSYDFMDNLLEKYRNGETVFKAEVLKEFHD